MKKLTIAFVLIIALFSCKKEKSNPVIDSSSNATQYGMTVFKDQSSTISHNALVAQYVGQNLEYVINMYGSFNPDKTPENIKTITYQKINNDTLHYFLIDTITNKMQSAFYEVKGIKSPVVIKFDYLKSLTNDVRVSFFSYDWQSETSDLLSSTVCKGDTTLNKIGNGLKKRGLIKNILSQIKDNFGLIVSSTLATDVIIAGFGGTTTAILSTTTAATAAAAFSPFIGAGVVLAAITIVLKPSTSHADMLTPADKAYPKNTIIVNPITVNNTPVPHLETTSVTDVTAKDLEIDFSATMDKNGTISITGVQGGTAPYTFFVGPSEQSTPIFANNYVSGEYLIAVKDVTKLVKSKKFQLIRSEDSVSKDGYGPNITDIDGNTYKTVYIGTQQWMAENLKTSKYNDGTVISNVTNLNDWVSVSSGAWGNYENNSYNNYNYGKLYNWATVGSGKVCPTGWHVPTESEWTVLTDYLGGSSVAGGKMKEVGFMHWDKENTDATNTSLFSALPGGMRMSMNFGAGDIGISGHGYWWSKDIIGSQATYFNLQSNVSGTGIGSIISTSGLSIRCLKD